MVLGELPVLNIMRDVSLPTVANLDFAETLYAEYLRNPSAVPAEWRAYFATLSNGEPLNKDFKLEPSFRHRSIFNPAGAASPSSESEEEMMLLQHRMDRLIRTYRERGLVESGLALCGSREADVP
jgi:2-oxoglutarate dehydrogenase E1 component